MSAHPFDSLRAPRNARQAHAAMLATARTRQIDQAALRHLHRRAQQSPDWRQGRGPVEAHLTPQGTVWGRWIFAALVAVDVSIGIAIARWMA